MAMIPSFTSGSIPALCARKCLSAQDRRPAGPPSFPNEPGRPVTPIRLCRLVHRRQPVHAKGDVVPSPPSPDGFPNAAYDWQMIADNAQLVIDTRNAMRRVKGDRRNVVCA